MPIDWFESFRAGAEDYKDDRLQALEASKFGTTPYTPCSLPIAGTTKSPG
jgi:hypothetical protein